MDIVEELRQNREAGARRLETEYKAGLMALARRFCNDPGDAEELVNSTFAEVIENVDDFLEQSSLFTWMCKILTSKFSRTIRRKSNQMEVFSGVVPDMEDERAREAIYASLDASFLRDAISRLPDDQREVIVLRYFTDMPISKIAKFLSIPSGTVRSRLHYARLALAEKLGAKVKEAAKKPGVKALLVVLALAALTALGAAVAVVATTPTPSANLQDTCDGGGATTTPELASDGEGAVATMPDSTAFFHTSFALPALSGDILPSQPKGETMDIRKTRAAMLAAATVATGAAIPLAASGDNYQYIVSGDTAAVAVAGVVAGESATASLDVRRYDVAESRTLALTSIKPTGFVMVIR